MTLDLGGHQIVGRGAGDGVRITADGVVVRNGKIQAFQYGVHIESDDRPSGVTASHLDLASHHGAGVLGNGLLALRVEESTIHDNGFGITLISALGTTIVNNRLLNNDATGIGTTRMDASLLQGNLVMHNGDTGVSLNQSTSRVVDNSFHRNGGDGLAITETCGTFLNFYRVGSNVADGNQRLGISVFVPPECASESPFDLLDAGGNAAKHNGDARQCTIHVKCSRNRGQASKLDPVTARLSRSS